MSRLIAASCFALVLWAPRIGAAGAGVCAEPTFERVADTAGAIEAEDGGVISVVFIAQPLGIPGDAPFDDVPWCASADDPRCAPLPANSDPRSPKSHAPLNATNETPRQAAWPRGTAHSTARTGLSEQTGKAQRIERPPR